MSRLLWYPGHELLVTNIVRAENCHVYDAEGKRYLDLESGVWCTSIGHNHPRLLGALADRSNAVRHAGFNYTAPVLEEAAEEILSLLGFAGGRCVFLCSGSEAVEYGVRVAGMIGERPLLMTLADSYFGAYGSATLKRAEEWTSFDWSRCGSLPGTGPGSSGVPRDEPGCREGCPHWPEIPFDRIRGFLFEPGSSSGLVRFPPRELIQGIVRTIHAGGGLVLVNEVTTGIGRTGEWFGYQHYGFTPDIVALGKGIGNGYPISVAAFSPRAVERLGERPVKYAQSHQNDPLGARVALEVLRTIREERLVERGREMGARLLAGLRALAERTGRIRDVRGRGLMMVVELEDDAEGSRTARVHRELVRRGYLVGRRPGTSVLRLDPALTVEARDLQGFLDTFEEVLGDRKTGAMSGTR
jgi:acetylornithine aminotransferase